MNYEKRPGLFRTSIRNDVKTRNLSEKKRRDQFNMLINELCSMVSTNNRKMDKSTVLKSTIAFLKNYQEISVQSQAHEIKENWKPPFLSNDEFTQLMLEALDSFLLVFSQQGSILYASESVTSLLGHLPNNIVNRSIFDLIHEDDKMNLYNLISTHGSRDQDEASPSDSGALQFSLRCHLKRGLLLPSDEQIYEFVHLAGNVRVWNGDPAGSAIDSDDESFFSNKSTDTMCFCCTVRLETSQLIREMSAVDEVNTHFTSRHSMEWKFLFLDHRAPPIIGYLPFELLGTSGYDYYHPEDLEKISSCHEQLMLTGEGKSCPYRFLTKGQQWIWLKTRFFITYHQWNCKPEFIVCTHTLISYADVCAQLQNDDDLDDGDGESSRCRSPSAYSVTSAGQGRCKMSSTTSQQSNSPGPHGSGRDTPQKPHSTAHPSPRASLPSESSPHSTLQPPVQGILVPAEMFVSPPSPNVQPQARVLSPLVPQSPSSTASMPVCSSTVTNPPTSPLPAQLFLTPAQSHLHKQLQQKSQLLQQAILQQQAELQQINSQLAQAKSSMLPLPPAQSTGPDTGGDRHWVLGAPPAFPQYSPFSTYGGGVMAVTTTQPMPPTPPLPATLGQPAPLVQPLLPPVSLTQPSQPQPSENQDQLFPYQFLQPQQDLYSHSHMNSMGHPPNPLD